MNSAGTEAILPGMAPGLNALNDCGCCNGIGVQTPVEINNRPGLNALAYRVGTYSRFRDSMLARLSAAAYPALANLRTRNDDDPTIALIDAFSAVADVLTFYQERIVNEAYLRTATERRSVLELARFLGYELNPGVAAGAYLAFTLDTAAGAAQTAAIDAGTKVQSVPAPGQKAQTFETIQAITGHTEWNAIAAQTGVVNPVKPGATAAIFKGTATNLKPGDMLLFVDSPGQPKQQFDFQRVTSVTPNKQSGITNVAWENGVGAAESMNGAWPNPPSNIVVFALRQRAALFGANAPAWKTLPDSIKEQYVSPSLTPGLFGEYFAGTDLSNWVLSRTDANISFPWNSGSPAPGLGGTNFSVRWTGLVQAPITGTYTFQTLSDDGVKLWVDGQLLFSNWNEHPQATNTATAELNAGNYYQLRLEYFQGGGGSIIQLQWTVPGGSMVDIPTSNLFTSKLPDEWPNFNPAYAATPPSALSKISLDNHYPQVVASDAAASSPDKWVLLTDGTDAELYEIQSVRDGSQSRFTLSAKTTDLTLSSPDGQNASTAFGSELREIVAFVQSEVLELGEAPVPPISGNIITLAQSLANVLTSGQTLAVSGNDAGTGKPLSEIVAVASFSGTTLAFTPALKNTYAPGSLVINANVASATHGETVPPEILGNGDASQPFQEFTLKQSPLTYVSSASPSGADSSLSIYVNDIKWTEAPSFYGRGPEDHIFTTRIANDGTTTVEFGDGVTGARLPSGTANVTANYRKGIGVAGDVTAGQLTTLLKRPAGVKSVTNPQAASGGANSATLDDARSNATLNVLTFDRVVSLQDYEDFARAFSGIAKALATWTWNGEVRGVFLTVAGPDGAEVPANSQLYINLVSALQSQGDPYVKLNVASQPLVTFTLAANLQIDPSYQPALVIVQVQQALSDAFSFDARSFAQAVALSEVYEVIARVPGVIASEVTALYLTSDPPARSPVLSAAYPAPGSTGDVQPAQLLVLDPQPLQLGIMK